MDRFAEDLGTGDADHGVDGGDGGSESRPGPVMLTHASGRFFRLPADFFPLSAVHKTPLRAM
jgi:hypothetical protein